MNRMKNIFLGVMAFAVCVLLVQCRKPVFPDFGGGEQQTITVTTGDNGDKGDFYYDAVGKILRYKWDKTNDKDVIHVYAQTDGTKFNSGIYLGSIGLVETYDNGYRATFGGQLKNVPKKGWLRFVHYGHDIDISGIGTTGVSVDFSNQKGTLSYVSDNVVSYYDVEINDSYFFNITGKMIMPYALVLFDFSNVGTEGEKGNGNTLVADGITKNGISVGANGVISEIEGDDMTLCNVKKDPYYVMFAPGGNGNYLVFRGGDGRDGGIALPTMPANTFFDRDANDNSIKLEELYVDFGIEGLPVFYKYNVGVDPKVLAVKSNWYGDFYAWGETAVKNLERYEWDTYKWCKGAKNTLTRYCKNKTHGTVDNKNVLDPEDDVAQVVMGRGWRIPSRAEVEKLSESAGKFEIVRNYNGISGLNGCVLYKNKGTGGSSYDYNTDIHIFFPACGAYSTEYDVNMYRYEGEVSRYWYNETTQIGNDSYDDIWAGTIYLNLNDNPQTLAYDSNNPRCYGFSVRAVHDGMW